MEQEFRAIVKTATGLSNVNWGASADDVYPAIDILLESEPGVFTINGRRDEGRIANLIVDIWSNDIGEAIELKNSLMAIDAMQPVDGCIVQIMINDFRSASDLTDDAPPIYNYSFQISVLYNWDK